MSYQNVYGTVYAVKTAFEGAMYNAANKTVLLTERMVDKMDKVINAKDSYMAVRDELADRVADRYLLGSSLDEVSKESGKELDVKGYELHQKRMAIQEFHTYRGIDQGRSTNKVSPYLVLTGPMDKNGALYDKVNDAFQAKKSDIDTYAEVLNQAYTDVDKLALDSEHISSMDARPMPGKSYDKLNYELPIARQVMQSYCKEKGFFYRLDCSEFAGIEEMHKEAPELGDTAPKPEREVPYEEPLPEKEDGGYSL